MTGRTTKTATIIITTAERNYNRRPCSLVTPVVFLYIKQNCYYLHQTSQCKGQLHRFSANCSSYCSMIVANSPLLSVARTRYPDLETSPALPDHDHCCYLLDCRWQPDPEEEYSRCSPVIAIQSISSLSRGYLQQTGCFNSRQTHP